MTIRTRFAPSPTGYLHLGGVRTALFNWLYAKRHNGEYVLRIEDTDQQRSSSEFTEDILSNLSWLGMEADTGPVFQSSRLKRYSEIVQQLLDLDLAYYCYCSRERLDAIRKEQIQNKQKPRYDGFCRSRKGKVAAGSNPVVRFKNPLDGSVRFEDLVHGPIEIMNSELDDLVLARSDGSPTYNLCVVVDDSDHSITHVIRGDDHLSNTPRQINLFKSLGMPLPKYAHIPLIHGKDGKRLSKRHGTMSVHQYRKDGFLAKALMNYLVRLGWSSGDQELFSVEEMIELFSLTSVQQSPAVFDPDKLLWVNHQHLKQISGSEILDELALHFRSKGIRPDGKPELDELFDIQKDRCKTLVEICDTSTYFYADISHYEENSAKKNFNHDGMKILQNLKFKFEQVDDWSAHQIKSAINSVSSEMGLKFGQVAPTLRLAVTGKAISPSIDITLELLGVDKTMHRIDQAIEYIADTI